MREASPEEWKMERDALLKRYSGHLPEHIEHMLAKREALKKARAARAANRAADKETAQ